MPNKIENHLCSNHWNIRICIKCYQKQAFDNLSTNPREVKSPVLGQRKNKAEQFPKQSCKVESISYILRVMISNSFACKQPTIIKNCR